MENTRKLEHGQQNKIGTGQQNFFGRRIRIRVGLRIPEQVWNKDTRIRLEQRRRKKFVCNMDNFAVTKQI
jgi:hypothetical protein